jgi:mRNA-degrading endonuclease RelE of RelBE toxin-antitoxin system
VSDWTIEFAQQPDSYFKRLERSEQDRITKKLEEVCTSHLEHSLRLVNTGGQRRARVGHLRIFFDVYPERRRLEVTAILSRGDAYRHKKK